MEIFVKEIENQRTIQFPALPESVTFESATRFIEYDIMDLGTVQIPNGKNDGSISWEGMLPGEARKNETWISGEWKSPKELQTIFSFWRTNGTPLRLIITDTPINHDVYLNDYQMNYSGAYGDYIYSISFNAILELEVEIVGKTGGTNGSSAAKPTIPTRPSTNAKAKTHRVVGGESLWSIAQKEMGNGAKYPQLYEANKALIDQRNKGKKVAKYTIYAGQVLKIPS